LALRTWAGERYYKAILDYRYALYAVGLLLAASFGNLLLTESPPVKYALLLGILGLACFLFREEVRQLWRTALQVLKEGKGALVRRKNNVESGAESGEKPEEEEQEK
jgi:hypothetical protein